MLIVRLFGLCLFRFVGVLFLLGSRKGCGLWLWHSLDFSLTFLLSIDYLKIGSGNEIRTQGQTHGRPVWNHITPRLLCGGVYKKKSNFLGSGKGCGLWLWTFLLPFFSFICCYWFRYICNIRKGHIYFNKQHNIVICRLWISLLDIIQNDQRFSSWSL